MALTPHDPTQIDISAALQCILQGGILEGAMRHARPWCDAGTMMVAAESCSAARAAWLSLASARLEYLTHIIAERAASHDRLVDLGVVRPVDEKRRRECDRLSEDEIRHLRKLLGAVSGNGAPRAGRQSGAARGRSIVERLGGAAAVVPDAAQLEQVPPERAEKSVRSHDRINAYLSLDYLLQPSVCTEKDDD